MSTAATRSAAITRSPRAEQLAVVRARPGRALLPACLLLAVAVMLALPAAGRAAMMTFGSPLSAPATLDTANDLSYAGTNPTATVHVNHDGADTAIWNVSVAGGTAAAPAEGQIVKVMLEGCAEQATNGPPPLTQIHFQVLTPTSGGSVTVDVTSQSFDIPTCGVDGASDSTITTYAPGAFCVHQGDYVDFNDEGGFDPNYYPSGVPYAVLGSVSGSTSDSFIADNGTNNGDTLSSSVTTASNGFASNPNRELMLQAQLATGADATGLCPGGTKGGGNSGGNGSGSGGSGSGSGSTPGAGQPGGPPGVAVGHQNDGVNHSRDVGLAVYCAETTSCAGSLTLTDAAGRSLATQSFTIASSKVSIVKVRLTAATLSAIRAAPKLSLPATLTVTLPGEAPVSAKVTLYI